MSNEIWHEFKADSKATLYCNCGHHRDALIHRTKPTNPPTEQQEEIVRLQPRLVPDGDGFVIRMLPAVNGEYVAYSELAALREHRVFTDLAAAREQIAQLRERISGLGECADRYDKLVDKACDLGESWQARAEKAEEKIAQLEEEKQEAIDAFSVRDQQVRRLEAEKAQAFNDGVEAIAGYIEEHGHSPVRLSAGDVRRFKRPISPQEGAK